MKAAVATAFVAGFGALATEILAARRFAPYFGATLETWATLIAATLLFGAAGALFVGLSTRPFAPSAEAFAFLGAAVWIFGVAAYGGALIGACAAIDGRLSVAVASAAVVGPPSFFFGATTPLSAARVEASPRATVGALLGASTLGSLFGALGAALVGAPHLGTRATAFVVAAAAALRAAADRRATRSLRVVAATGAAACAVFASRGGAIASTASRFVRETAYGTLVVEKSGSGVAVFVDGVPQARAPLGPLAPGALLPDRDAVALLPYLRPTAKDALLIGLGAGLHARALSAHGIAATTIELDPALVSVASDLLGYDGDVIVGDGRVVARRLSRVFDGVVVDAFTGETPPAHLATIEAFRCFRERLTSEGVLFVHMIDRPSGGAALAVARTAAEVFASVRLLRTRATDDMQDLHLVASDGGVTPPPHPDLIAAGWPVYPRDVVVVPPGLTLGDDANAFEALDAAAARERRARALSERKR